MMSQAFYTGVAGIKSNATGIDVVSNNLANVSTTGYRGSEAEFSSIFESAVLTGTTDNSHVGQGVQVQATSMMENQGTALLSERSTDVSIAGDGWFGVEQGGVPVYTRDGSFSFDANKNLVTADGYNVLGTMGKNISADGVLEFTIGELPLGDVETQEKLRFPDSLVYPPEATTDAKFIANVGVGYEPFTVGASVVDSQNNENSLSIEFVKNAEQVLPNSQFTAVATVSSADGTTLYDTQTGEVEFDSSGALISSTLTSIDNNGTAVNIDLGTGFDGVTSIDLPYSTGSSVTDGSIGGELVGYEINKNAEVTAVFTNGKQSSVGKIAVYHFTNDQGLDRISGTRFQASSNSGEARFRQDADGQNINGSDVNNFQLEGSNVELSYGLTELIILQRSYDANSKSITTADQMMQKALSMDA